MVDYWRDKNTSAIVESVGNASSLTDGIFRFFDTCVDKNQFDPQLDLAIREWARRSEAVRLQVDAADSTRVQLYTVMEMHSLPGFR